MSTTTATAPKKATTRAGKTDMPSQKSFTWRGYQAPKIGKYAPGGFVLSILGVAAMLILVPFVQSITGGKQDQMTVRQFDVSLPPPPPPPPEPPPPQNEQVEEPPPQMQPPPMNLSLNQLSMAINPGVGGALAGDFGLGEVSQVSSEDTLQDIQLFDIAELDEKPRRLTDEQFDAPPRMRQNRTPGSAKVVVIINPDGTVRVGEVIESNPPELAQALVAYLERQRYTKPMKGGQAVSARYILPFELKW
ncbi:MAG: periplasmic protein TonB [Puniceicoccaceae bacterium 5H]|nr:MAG: periplasmic protein TonB [Puniceicoccaceae bacterium 5H]